jgi:uncharacterized membrane protein HdeD (DUF308 family)
MDPLNRRAGVETLADINLGTICRGIARGWWILAARGALTILFGLILIAWTDAAPLGLAIFWGVFAFADGIMALVAGIRGRWWGMVVVGILGIAAGLITLIFSEAVIVAITTFIAVWVIVHGIFEVAAAIALRTEIENEWSLLAGGALSIVYGVVVLVYPRVGVISWVWLIGGGAILFGILLLVLAFRLKAIGDRLPAPSRP